MALESLSVNLSKHQEDFKPIFEKVLEEQCYYKESFASTYWRDAMRVGYAKAKFILDKDMTFYDAKEFLKDLTELETIGIIQYCMTIKKTDREFDYLMEQFFQWNPFGEDMIFHASVAYFKNKDWGLTTKLKDMPEQKLKFLKHFNKEDKSQFDEEYDMRKDYPDNEKYFYYLHDIPEKELTDQELEEYYSQQANDQDIDDTFDD